MVMTIGPVQLLVLGLSHPDFEGEILKELQRLRENDLIRVIDALAVYKDADGNVAKMGDSPAQRRGDGRVRCHRRCAGRLRRRARRGHGGRGPCVVPRQLRSAAASAPMNYNDPSRTGGSHQNGTTESVTRTVTTSRDMQDHSASGA
jgi:hypothetical protein